MGSIAVFLYKHARALIAWTAFVALFATFMGSIWSSPLIEHLGDWIIDAVRFASRVVSSVPNSVSNINSGIQAAINGSDIASLIFWAAGLDVVLDMIAFIAAQVSGFFAFCLTAVAGTISLLAAYWVYRLGVRFSKVVGGSELGNIDE